MTNITTKSEDGITIRLPFVACLVSWLYKAQWPWPMTLVTPQITQHVYQI